MKKLSIVWLSVLIVAAALRAPAATYGPNVQVQVIVEAQTKHGKYRSAIVYPKAVYDARSDAQVTADINANVAAWVAAVDAAKTAPPPVVTKTDLEAEKAQLEARLAVVNAEIAKK